MSSRHVCCALTSAVALCWGPGLAVASNVDLLLKGCPGLDQTALREHLDLELLTLKLERVVASLRVTCEQDVAEIRVDGPVAGDSPFQVRVELRDTAAGARERLVALAATELLSRVERSGESARPAEPPIAPEASSTAAEARDAVPVAGPARRSVELFAAASVARTGQPGTLLWGGALGTLVGWGKHGGLLFDMRFESGETALELASVRWSVLSAFAGPALRFELSKARFVAGLGLRGGWLALDATATAPNEGQRMTAPWAGVAFPLRVSAGLGVVAPFLGLEGGYVLLPVRGDVDGEATLVAQRGPWLAASLGLGVAL
ncbi:MAG TPA: hypothetical protein VIW29_13770 [Polyangiaceae bacterium]